MTDISRSWDAFVFARCVILGDNRRADRVGAKADQQALRDTLVTLLAHVLDAALPNKADQLAWLDNAAVAMQIQDPHPPKGKR